MIPIGTVLHLLCRKTKPQKYKYLVVGCNDPDLKLFYINSKISRFDLQKERLNSCNVSLPKDPHPFLKRDSYIRCCEFSNEFELQQTIALSMEKNIAVGKIADRILFDVLQAVKATPLISEVDKTTIINAIENKINLEKQSC